MIPYVVDHGSQLVDFGAQLTLPSLEVGDMLFFILYDNYIDVPDLSPPGFDLNKADRLFAWNLIPNTFNLSLLAGWQVQDPSVTFVTTGYPAPARCLWVVVRAANSGVGYVNGLGVGSYAYNETNTTPSTLTYGGNNNFYLGNSPDGEVLVIRMVTRTSSSGTQPGIGIPDRIEQAFLTDVQFFDRTVAGAIGASVESIPIAEPSIDAGISDPSYGCQWFVIAVTNYDPGASPTASPPGVTAPVGSSVLPVSGAGLPSNSSSIVNANGDELVSEDGDYLVWEA